MTHKQPFTFDADHPAVLVGQDNGPTPVEYLLHAIAACLTAGIANIAAARGVNLDSVESTVEGDIDLLGILGLSDDVRNGYKQIRASFTLRGDDPEKLARSSSSPAAVRRVRRADQRRPRRHHRRRRLDPSTPCRRRPGPLRVGPLRNPFPSGDPAMFTTHTIVIERARPVWRPAVA